MHASSERVASTVATRLFFVESLISDFAHGGVIISYRLPLALLLAGTMSLAAFAQRTQTPPSRTINVTGSAERRVSPDLGVVVLAIQTQSTTVAHAAQQNNSITNSVMETLHKLAIPTLTMRTIGFNVTPRLCQEPTPGQASSAPPKITGYQVVNRLEVRVADVDSAHLADEVGRVLDTALAAGANRVDAVTFTLRISSRCCAKCWRMPRVKPHRLPLPWPAPPTSPWGHY